MTFSEGLCGHGDFINSITGGKCESCLQKAYREDFKRRTDLYRAREAAKKKRPFRPSKNT